MGDAFARHLRTRGYNALALPDSRFAPLTLVYEHNGNHGRSADFGYLVQNATAAAPTPDQPTREPGFSGKEVRALDVSGTISVLSGLISALGGGTLGVKGGFENASTVTFRYGDVTMTEVSEAALDRYLQSGQSDRTTVPGRYLGDHLYVATRVLRSRSFEVSAQDSKGHSIGLDLPAIGGAIGAGVSAKWSTGSEATITFKGDYDVTFAFQAFRILEKNGRMRIFPAQAGEGGLARRYTKQLSGDDFADLLPTDPSDATPVLLGSDDSVLTFDNAETIEP